MTRIAVALTAIFVILGLGSATAVAAPSSADTGSSVSRNNETDTTRTAEADTEITLGDDSPGVLRIATDEDVAEATPSGFGPLLVRTLRACGVGALVGATTDQFDLKNVIVFVNALGDRLAAIASGPVAVITVAAGGCIDRALASLNAESEAR